ncbi:hypothetical protein PN36_03720 [Candidatus Thiomargarita nelsonii]|uniref:Uncharacterized protein n=1 Tax=Candidatus Thiomargarita nelsonii TaxID=1003181 RepID=A0A0A6P7P4_9GAMM|nr:hypothetical protein PN36_03720 [Candidatus Thiomargarita nelsonii]
MHNHINGSFEQFISNYKGFWDYDIQLHPTDALRSLQSVFAAVKSTPYKIYLLIDEYDTIFKAVKSGTKGLGIDRIFITGVSPVVMSDITSGFNMAENIYFEPEFNNLCGFWETEIAEALQQIAISCNLSTEKVTQVLEIMRVFYDGYNFSNEPQALIYNPTLALYFLKHFQKRCQYPRRILDTNLAMDKGKITYIRPDMRQYQLLDFLIEFKYVSLKKAELSGEQAKKMSLSELNALEAVKEKIAESKTQLNNYRQILLSHYGNKLRLRTYSVVAVGYERLVVCEI